MEPRGAMMAIIRNRAQCENCGDIIESKHRHDFVHCSCFDEYDDHPLHGIYVDGGTDYLRRGAVNISEFKELSELNDE